MMDTAALQEIVASNSRARGVSTLCRPVFWDNALQLLTRSSQIAIVTGFFIRSAGACETDGPPGAAVLGRALASMGKNVILLTDDRNYECLRACSRSIGGPSVARVDGPEKIPSEADLLVYIERPGRGADGRYHNMKGMDISDVVVPLDDAMEPAMQRGASVLGIGDGGNEAGMGLLYDELAALMPHYVPSLSRVSSHICLPVDLSNWGGYALAAILSCFYRRWAGLDKGEEALMLDALLKAGAVDGVTGVADTSVDGVSLEELEEISSAIRNWYFGSFRV